MEDRLYPFSRKDYSFGEKRRGTVVFISISEIRQKYIKNVSGRAERYGGNIGKRMKRNLERSKRLDSDSPAPDCPRRKRKAEVIDAGIPFPPLQRNRAGKGSRKLDGEGQDRKRESCNLYIKASIERVSSILAKREEDIQTRESIYIFTLPVYGVSRNNSYEVFSKSGLMCSYRVSCPAKFTNARSPPPSPPLD